MERKDYKIETLLAQSRNRMVPIRDLDCRSEIETRENRVCLSWIACRTGSNKCSSLHLVSRIT